MTCCSSLRKFLLMADLLRALCVYVFGFEEILIGLCICQVAVIYFHDEFTMLKGVGLFTIILGVSLFNWYITLNH
ncbi:hypothetical protein RchiOBHm_Chr2g0131291 [Rosa chinensis]|uniref:Uncharacterized protein n=1 Tax=Rosa chinensis TaxID=74649 RepID=A0A2P6RV05_ROSCH|nr:hypothetical protein RchiOBHm_Chr2g0131291 [Rosa chinensis]